MFHGLAGSQEEGKDEGEVSATGLLVHGAGVEAHSRGLLGVRRRGAADGVDVHHGKRGEEDLGEDRIR